MITPIMNYDNTSGELIVTSRITKGQLSPLYMVTVQLYIIISLFGKSTVTQV